MGNKMAFTLEVASSTKGSNPGGRCTVRSGNQFNAYFKYCYGSKISGRTSFQAQHQPFYEAITFALARTLGLKTADFYVLLNYNNDVKFNNWRNFGDSDPSGRRAYCLSRIIPWAGHIKGGVSDGEVVENERPYLESLLIADIIGKRQNYTCVADKEGNQHVFYLDLGCSFVHATEGFLQQPNKFRFLDKLLLKHSRKKLKEINLISADNMDFVNAEQLVEGLPNLKIPCLNPRASLPVGDLISGGEIDEIRNLLTYGVLDGLQGYERKGLVIKQN